MTPFIFQQEEILLITLNKAPGQPRPVGEDFVPVDSCIRMVYGLDFAAAG